MNQEYSYKVREATLNVGCLGVFTITVVDDGFWEVRLDTSDGNTYYRSRGTMLRPNLMMNHKLMTSLELPEWMWEPINQKIDELKLAHEHDALYTPDIKGATA